MKKFLLLIPLLLIILVDFSTQRSINAQKAESLVSILNHPPTNQSLYFLGNSMFKTGIDPELIQRELPNEEVLFDPYSGYYTSFWYLIAKKIVVPQTQHHPKVFIWGYRPHYAKTPFFRSKAKGLIDKILTASEDNYLEMIGEKSSLVHKEGFSDWYKENSFLLHQRSSFRLSLSQLMTRMSLKFLSLFPFKEGLRSEASFFAKKSVSFSDYLTYVLSRGRYLLSEEKIQDKGDKFIVGPEKTFNQSLIPTIAKTLQSAQIPQIIILFRPYYIDNMQGLKGDLNRFVQSSIQFFEANNILYLNLFELHELKREHFASGDHLNSEGRRIISLKLSQLIREYLLKSAP